MYYLIVVIAVITFGGCFALNDVYRKLRTSSFVSSMENAFLGAAAGLIVLLCIGGFSIQATPFTLGIAFLSSLVSIGFSWCAFQALDRTNLSLFSLYSMLGGMLLPFFQGIVFFGEDITVAKVICVIILIVGLCIPTQRGGGKSGAIYYIGIFVLNGMSGVLSKLFAAAPFEKTSADWYSIWSAFFTLLLSGLLWLILTRKNPAPKISWKAIGVSSLNGAINRVANFLLVIALVHIDASVQYPMITGGVIIVSTVLSLLSKNKPSKKEIWSVLLVFIGLLVLFLVKV